MKLFFKLFFSLILLSSGYAHERKIPENPINDDMEYALSRVDVLGSRISYIDAGEGDPVLFIHGNPTSSYLWRNIIPFITRSNRAIAVDLIGMGKSAKPDIAYSYQDQYQYLSAFINSLKLNNITLVVHDWGAGLGFDFARQNPDKIKAIAFMEGILPPIFPQPSFEAMGKEMGAMFRALKDPIKGDAMVFQQHMFVEQVLPGFINRTITDKAMNYYRAPFVKQEDRKPILAWPRAVPIAGQPENVVTVMEAIKKYMQSTSIPILLIYASPGVLVNDDVKKWYQNNIKNIETAYVGQGMHFIQEDQPKAIGSAISDWLRRHKQ